MDPSIDLRHLRYFLAVVDELHFGRAATRLGISQPPLSQAIRKLEQELGVQLLQRNSRSVAPTPAGLAFAEEARAVLGQLEVAVAQARHAAGARSTVRIGAIPTVGLDKLRRFLGALAARDPTLQSQVTHLGSMEQVQRLRRGELDFGIFHLAVRYPGIETEPMFAGERAVALLPSEHRLLSKRELGPADVRDEVLVVFPRWINPGAHDAWLLMIERAGYSFGNVYAVPGSDPRDVILAVASGSGITFGSTSYIATSEASAVVAHRPLANSLSLPELGLAWRSSAPRAGRRLVELGRDTARELRQMTVSHH
jgi:DNA-binding transcriptional LysR family regulator